MMALTFCTTGMPANTASDAIAVTGTEGSQDITYTTNQHVYLSNHN